MAFAADILEETLQYYRVGLVRLGVDPAAARAAVAPGGDVELRFRSIATQLMRADAFERSLENATFADTAEGEQMVRLAAIEGIDPSPGSGATGSVVVSVSSLVVIAADAELTGDSTGLRYRTTSQAVVNPAIPASLSVPVVGIDVGVATNLDPGETLTWSSPPVALNPTATVGAGGLTGGYDEEGVEGLRQRYLAKKRDPGFGGNSAHVVELLKKASLAVSDAYCFPGLQGPNTLHAAIGVAGTAANAYSRIADAALLQSVGAYVVGQLSESGLNFTLTGLAHQPLDLVLALALPLPTASGAAQGGWLDLAPSPAAPCSVVSAGSTTTWRVSTAIAPVAFKQVSVWRSASLDFARTQIATVTPAGGTLYDLTLAVPVAGVSVGDQVSPTSARESSYAASLLASVAALAAGQKSASSAVLERARRRPVAAVSALTTSPAAALQAAYAEVASAAILLVNGAAPVLPLEPPVPGSVALPPNVWKLRNLGFSPV